MARLDIETLNKPRQHIHSSLSRQNTTSGRKKKAKIRWFQETIHENIVLILYTSLL